MKDGRALRIETVINAPNDLGCQRRLHNLDELQAKARAVNARVLQAERVGQGCVLANPVFERIAHPTVTAEGRRATAMRFGDSRVQALAGALCVTLGAVTGITNRSLRALMTGLLGVPYGMTQASYDLARLRRNGLIIRRPHTNTYDLTADGLRFAIFYTKVHDRVLTPLFAADQPQAPPELRAALHTLDQHIDQQTRPRPTAHRSLKLGSTVEPLATKAHLGVARSRRVRRFRIADPPQPVESLLGAGRILSRFSNQDKRDASTAEAAGRVPAGRCVSFLVSQHVSQILGVGKWWDVMRMTAMLGYARVSTIGQDLDAQLAALDAAGVDPSRVFTDKLSGSAKTARPGLVAMLDYARPGDTVVVAAIDRLGRSVAEVTRTIADLGERRITLWLTRRRRYGHTSDTATPTGRAIAAIMATVAPGRCDREFCE